MEAKAVKGGTESELVMYFVIVDDNKQRVFEAKTVLLS